MEAFVPTAVLAALAIGVGFLIGAVGIGGVLLIPAIAWLTERSIHVASATALFSFVFTGLYGVALHRKHRGLDWARALPLCSSALVLAIPGVWVAYQLSGPALTTLIGLLVALAGIHVLLDRHRIAHIGNQKPPGRELLFLSGVGAVSGFGSGVSGAGGPLFSVPIMLMAGYSPLAAIGASQLLQVFAATAGSISHIRMGTIDFGLAAILVVFELVGVLAGARFAGMTSTARLRALAGTACLVIGMTMLWPA